jgi:competence protein ComEA
VAQWSAAFLLGLVAAILIGRILPIFDRGRPTDRDRIVVVAVDLNTANKSDILQLPGVGDKTADRILAARQQSSGIKSTDDLKGLGRARVEAIRPHLTGETGEQFVRTSTQESEIARSTPTKASRGKKDLPAGMKIDVNGASVEELQKLDGIGPVMAARIVEERKKALFRSPDDLRRVKGIGPKTLEKLRIFVTCD